MNRPQQMSADAEEILHHAVDGRKALWLGGWLVTGLLCHPEPQRDSAYHGAQKLYPSGEYATAPGK